MSAAYPTGAYPTGGAIADFNHDGIPDVITAGYHGFSVSILLWTASGMSYDTISTKARPRTSPWAI